MAPFSEPSAGDLRALLAEIERKLADSEYIRSRADHQLRSKPVYPERRHPKHWEYTSDKDSDSSREGD